MMHPASRPLHVLIVDDEPLARHGIRQLLHAEAPDAEILEAAAGHEAVRIIRDRSPDIVLLDIQMPGLDGFGVIEEVGVEAMPAVIFITAHDEHALRAFDAHAVDYLLKPVDPVRFRDAMARAKRTISGELEGMREALAAALAQARQPSMTATPRLALRNRERIVFVRPVEIAWIEAAANYVRVHVPGAVLRHRATMEEMEEALGPTFVRVSRAALVRLDAIRACEAMGRGSFQLVLQDQSRIITSRH
ncbi:MAG: response regulator transcription factor, partial [Cytophagaceae bacterium]|nr:response regulator transcription factor [Gemmatimonadaceae bacterium]